MPVPCGSESWLMDWCTNNFLLGSPPVPLHVGWAQHHSDIITPVQRPRVIVGVKNHGILAPGDALPPPASSVCLAGAELRQVAATSPLEAACRCGSATPGLGTVLHAFGRAATPQPHDIAGHAVSCSRRMQPHADPSPTHFSTLDRQWSHDSQSFPRSIPDCARALVAHADGAAPHRTALLQHLRGQREAQREGQTRHSQRDTTCFLTSRPTSSTSLRWPWSSPTAL